MKRLHITDDHPAVETPTEPTDRFCWCNHPFAAHTKSGDPRFQEVMCDGCNAAEIERVKSGIGACHLPSETMTFEQWAETTKKTASAGWHVGELREAWDAAMELRNEQAEHAEATEDIARLQSALAEANSRADAREREADNAKAECLRHTAAEEKMK